MKTTIKYDSEKNLSVRLFDPSVGQWYTGTVWSATEANAQSIALTEKSLAESGASRYSKNITTWPSGNYLVEYVDTATSEVIGEDATVMLENVDVAISTRLSAGDYIEPDNTSIFEILAKTDTLPAHPAAQDLVEFAISSAINNLNDISSEQVLDEIRVALNEGFNDNTAITTNSLKDRLRLICLIMKNKMLINETTGDTTFYKDDNVTAAFIVPGMFTSIDGVATRKKIA